MSSGFGILQLGEEDVKKMLIAYTHIGSPNINSQMASYVYQKRQDGIAVINLARTWEKLQLAARAIVSIVRPSDIFAVSTRPYGQRAVLKFCHFTKCVPVAGRFSPGMFTNQSKPGFREPSLLIVQDPMEDHQAVREASYVNIPVIAFCNTDSPLQYVDISIPCNNKCPNSVGLMWWLLAREVQILTGTISRTKKWNIMVDLFIYREPEEIEKEELMVEELKKEKEEKEKVGFGINQPQNNFLYNIEGEMDDHHHHIDQNSVEPHEHHVNNWCDDSQQQEQQGDMIEGSYVQKPPVQLWSEEVGDEVGVWGMPQTTSGGNADTGNMDGMGSGGGDVPPVIDDWGSSADGW